MPKLKLDHENLRKKSSCKVEDINGCGERVPWSTDAQREEELDVTDSPKALPLRHLVDDLWNRQVSRSRIILEVCPHQ